MSMCDEAVARRVNALIQMGFTAALSNYASLHRYTIKGAINFAILAKEGIEGGGALKNTVLVNEGDDGGDGGDCGDARSEIDERREVPILNGDGGDCGDARSEIDERREVHILKRTPTRKPRESIKTRTYSSMLDGDAELGGEGVLLCSKRYKGTNSSKKSASVRMRDREESRSKKASKVKAVKMADKATKPIDRYFIPQKDLKEKLIATTTYRKKDTNLPGICWRPEQIVTEEEILAIRWHLGNPVSVASSMYKHGYYRDNEEIGGGLLSFVYSRKDESANSDLVIASNSIRAAIGVKLSRKPCERIDDVDYSMLDNDNVQSSSLSMLTNDIGTKKSAMSVTNSDNDDDYSENDDYYSDTDGKDDYDFTDDMFEADNFVLLRSKVVDADRTWQDILTGLGKQFDVKQFDVNDARNVPGNEQSATSDIINATSSGSSGN